jgi:hypothetical protein
MDIKSSLGFAARVRGKDDCALAPFLDMLNHSCDARVRKGVPVKKMSAVSERHVFGGCICIGAGGLLGHSLLDATEAIY